MRTIDADALMEVINRHCYPVQHDMTSIEPGMTRIGILQAIQEQPTIEPERKKGRWIVRIWEHGGTYGECSLCGLKQGAGYLNFCPNCGAKMEEAGSEDIPMEYFESGGEVNRNETD